MIVLIYIYIPVLHLSHFVDGWSSLRGYSVVYILCQNRFALVRSDFYIFSTILVINCLFVCVGVFLSVCGVGGFFLGGLGVVFVLFVFGFLFLFVLSCLGGGGGAALLPPMFSFFS